MQKKTPIRKHRTSAQRKQVLADYRRSGLTQQAFAARVGVSVSTLQLWLRQERGAPSVQATTFVPVPNLLAGAPAPAVYRLRLVGGAVLEIGSDYQPEQLEPLLHLLKVL
jgi:transposase-like protein